jgi:protein-L-isoaspartate(D-aspartate) O-methyltransferase
MAVNARPIRDSQPSVVRRLSRDDIYAAARERMVSEQLLARGLTNEKVLEAMRRVPRHNFVDYNQIGESYVDRTLAIAHNFSSGRLDCTLETAYVVASAAEQLMSGPLDRVLEIGAGAGYQTAVLSALSKEVYTLAETDGIAQDVHANLIRLDFTSNVHIRGGGDSQGWSEAGPFDAIILNHDEPISASILNQLKPGGRLIIPVKADGYLYVFQNIGGQLVSVLTRSVRPTPIVGNQVDVPAVQPILRKSQ